MSDAAMTNYGGPTEDDMTAWRLAIDHAAIGVGGFNWPCALRLALNGIEAREDELRQARDENEQLQDRVSPYFWQEHALRAVGAALTAALTTRDAARALRDAAEAAREMHRPVAPDCAEWADWPDTRARDERGDA